MFTRSLLVCLLVCLLACLINVAPAFCNGFIFNQGQIVDVNGSKRPDIAFTRSGSQGKSYFRPGAISSVTVHSTVDSAGLPESATLLRSDIEFLGARANCTPEGIDQRREYFNYYLPQCPDGILHVPSYAEIIYRELYPGVDVVVYEHDAVLEYDFVLRPGARVSDITMAVRGGIPSVDSSGALVITTEFGEERHALPRCIEQGREIAGSFVVDDSIVHITVPEHDLTQLLRIDPTVMWSTLFAGNANDVLHDVEVGPTNHVYVGGFSWSSDFPTTVGTFQKLIRGSADAIIARFDSLGYREWATFIGGGGIDLVIGLTVDRKGACWVTGDAGSGLPVTSDAFQTGFNGGGYDGWVAKFDSTGKRLYASYVGSSAYDGGTEIAVDSAGNVAFNGLTVGNMPTTVGAYQVSAPQPYNAWIMRMTSAGQVSWCTYLGGKDDERGRGLACDDVGNIYVTGMTNSTDFPLVRSQQTVLGGGSDAYITKFDAAGHIVWSEIFGGNGYDAGTRVKCAKDGSVYFEGPTSSTNLPTTSQSAQPAYAGGTYDAFVTKLDSGGVFQWTTYVGGSGEENNGDIDYFSGLTLARDGSVWITGRTTSSDLHGTPLYASSFSGNRDAFVARISNNGSSLNAAYIGGSDDDAGCGIAADSAGNIYVVGSTASTNFPTTPGAFQTTAKGQIDAFILRIGTCGALLPTVSTQGATTVCYGDSVILTASAGFASYQWTGGVQGQRLTVTKSGTYSLSVTDNNGCTGVSAPVKIVVLPQLFVTIAPLDSVSICIGDTVIAVASPGFAVYQWSDGTIGQNDTLLTPGTYTVMATDANGCKASSPPLRIVLGDNLTVNTTAQDTMTLCFGDTAFVDATPGFSTYVWSDGTKGPRIAVSKTGTYTVFVTKGSGCAGVSKPFYVNVLPQVHPAISPFDSASLCTGDTLIASASPGYANYVWSDGTIGEHDTITTPGLYAVTVIEASGCKGKSSSLVVTFGAKASVTTSVTGSRTVCFGDSIVIDATPGFATYQWSDGTKSPHIVIKKSGTYTVSVATASGCTGQSAPVSITILPPLIVVTIPTDSAFICAGDSLVVSASTGFSVYRWSNGSVGQNDTISKAGIYFVAVTDVNGCIGISTPLVVSVGTTQTIGTTIVGTQSICAGDTIDVDAAPGFSNYVWSDGTIGPHIRITRSGTYTVSVDVGKGCKGISNSIDVVVLPQTAVQTNPADSVFICPGDSLVIAASPGFKTYWWSDGTTSANDTITKLGTYIVRTIDSNGCPGIARPVYVGDAHNLSDTVDFSLISFSAAPGDTARVFVAMHKRKGATITAVTRIRLHLRVDQSLFYPVDVVDTMFVQGRERTIVKTLALTTDTTLVLNFLIALGDTDISMVHLDSVEVLDHCPPAAQWSGATFHLNNVCYQGGARFFVDTKPLTLSQTTPNPMATTARVAFTTMERGYTTLTVFDIFGRTVLVPFSGDVNAGDYVTEINAMHLPAGSYIYVLRTPTQSLRRLMQVEK